ncbi:MAG: N-acetyl-gamma-glutamyl-phosphate reductase [Nitrospiraceae bacterium]|nr:N-acetyl-gamma-glutamyl-phosphate reductase [Nitrospiraceae bacterium]
MLRIAICGGSGYTGGELIRLLLNHPFVEITAVTSEKSAGKCVKDIFPHLKGFTDLKYENLDRKKLLNKADLFFMALPHGTSQEAVDFFFKNNKKVIDLSADYRLKSVKTYKEWYKTNHKFPLTLKKAIYGLPELHRAKIEDASLVANPGCYPTSAILGLSPAFKSGLIDPHSIIVDSTSGTTGAGRSSDPAFAFSEVNEGFSAYAIGKHRHTPEIEQELSGIAKKDLKINFTPHLGSYDRGILSTIYARLNKNINIDAIIGFYKRAYAQEPFVRVLEQGEFPDVKDVRGTNLCSIGLAVNNRTKTLIIVSAIDNLVKGASGQAVQNMNIMMGFNETISLATIALFP